MVIGESGFDFRFLILDLSCTATANIFTNADTVVVFMAFLKQKEEIENPSFEDSCILLYA